MEWNLRLVAANRGIWTATELRRRLARHDLKVSAGKMSKWWSGRPISLKLTDLDVLCTVLGCTVDDLLTPHAPTPAEADGGPVGGRRRPSGAPGQRSPRQVER